LADVNLSIAVALLVQEQEFQRLQADDARAAAARNQVELEVLFAENSAILQIQQLFKLIHRPREARPRAIVVETVVGEGLERVARAAGEAGVGWVLINRRVPYIDALRRKHPDLPIASVGTDQVQVGRIQARQFRILVPSGEGVVLYLQGPPDTSAAQERLRGVQEGIAGTRLELRLLDGDWTAASGERAIERWLKLNTAEGMQPVLVGCQNDTMAMGAQNALKARPKMAGVPLVGCDGLPQGGQRLVDQGQLAATVITRPNTGRAIDLVTAALRGGGMPPAEVLLLPSSYPEEKDLEKRSRVRTGA
jgi:ABC-type sugar transport system substrate-binding protein